MADIRLSSAKALGDKDLLNATSPAVLRFELAANMATLDGTISGWSRGRGGRRSYAKGRKCICHSKNGQS
ncbi:hypothetical protein LTR91_026268 [Friedmanniomyces endolithicus]|uniref:Uncharacterized protein n=1 Tax=Friedmanniomyces endolithicus TaxID=329885 RepID=A0AAN6JYH6_9PEZI|nr:hypothetical protein LTR91_026268 [Friedmanniomyces endolithicus]KAK1020851.1 hypothetical protein LTS16_026871 [Friedmanniomyces endolithicus]